MRELRVIAGGVALLLAAGCVAVPEELRSSSTTQVADDARFEIGGRLSARHGREAVAGHFTWTRVPGVDRIDVATPMGQTVARLIGDASGVHLERPGERILAFADWNALTREVFGVAIPLEGLAHWIVGEPAAAPAGVERDAQGRLSVLRQHGWEIVYAYGERAPASRPSRLVMRYPDAEPIEVRIVVDRWTSEPAP